MVWGKIKMSETKIPPHSFFCSRHQKVFGMEIFFCKSKSFYYILFIFLAEKDKENVVHLWHMNKHDMQDQGIYVDMPAWIKIVKRQRHNQNESRRTRYLAMIYTSHCARRKDEKCDILCRWYWISSLSKFFPYGVIHYIC